MTGEAKTHTPLPHRAGEITLYLCRYHHDLQQLPTDSIDLGGRARALAEGVIVAAAMGTKPTEDPDDSVERNLRYRSDDLLRHTH